MAGDSGTLVHIGDSYFGTDVMYVSVEPRDDSSFAVVVSSAATDAKELPAVLRTWRDFWELHTALRSRILSHPLPHLPAKPEGLLSETSGGRTSTPGNTRHEYANQLQAYLVDLIGNEDLAVLPELAKFVGIPDGITTSAPIPKANSAPAAPAAAAPATGGGGGGGEAGVGEPRPSQIDASALALAAEVSDPQQTRVMRRATTENNMMGAAALVRIGAAASGGGTSPVDGKAARSGKATKVTLSWSDEAGDHSVELPVLRPSSELGNPVIDVQSLASKTGFFTHDPGFTSTSSCESAISFIDGDKGLLMHRGYAIEDLALNCSFPEVAFLLIEGELPARAELRSFEAEIKSNWLVHERLLAFFGGFKSDAHPMAIMVGVVGALSAFYPDSVNIHDAAQRRLSAIRLIAKMPTIAAIAYKTSIGQPIVYPSNRLGFAANFLHMMFATPAEPYTVNPVHAAALETILILHADHEQNASTSTVRIASSSQANPFACIAAGIASLWGPAHGGANEAVLRMLAEIGSEGNIPKFIERAKDKNDSFRLMGFGHRVYKNADPRAKLMQRICEQVFSGLNMASHPDLALARRLESIALSDEYFIKRKLYPNVDFYSGIVLRALGIPTDMFTVLFAVARTCGWLAQWNESFSDPYQRISRPRQLYSGIPLRPFLPLEKRANGNDSPNAADGPAESAASGAAAPAEAAPAAAVQGAAFAGRGVVVPSG